MSVRPSPSARPTLLQTAVDAARTPRPHRLHKNPAPPRPAQCLQPIRAAPGKQIQKTRPGTQAARLENTACRIRPWPAAPRRPWGRQEECHRPRHRRYASAQTNAASRLANAKPSRRAPVPPSPCTSPAALHRRRFLRLAALTTGTAYFEDFVAHDHQRRSRHPVSHLRPQQRPHVFQPEAPRQPRLDRRPPVEALFQARPPRPPPFPSPAPLSGSGALAARGSTTPPFCSRLPLAPSSPIPSSATA